MPDWLKTVAVNINTIEIAQGVVGAVIAVGKIAWSYHSLNNQGGPNKYVIVAFTTLPSIAKLATGAVLAGHIARGTIPRDECETALRFIGQGAVDGVQTLMLARFMAFKPVGNPPVPNPVNVARSH